jgi:hypothetical protein
MIAMIALSRGLAINRSYHQRFQIGAHDILNSANLCVLPEVIHGATPDPPAFPERFDSHVQTNLVSELETVDYRLRWCEYLDGDALYLMPFDTSV